MNLKKTIQNTNDKIKLFSKFIGGVCGLIVYSLPAYFSEKRNRGTINKNFLAQVYFTGNLALRLISIVALALGAVTVIQVFTQLSKIGGQEFIGEVLKIVIIRELGPLFTAFIVISRSSTAIASEIGNMVVTNQVDALEMMGIDPLTFIIFPRIIGVTLALVVLTICFNAIALIGGFLVSLLTIGLSFDIFFNYIMNTITFADIFSSLLKSLLFGLFISSIPIYNGFQVKSSTTIPAITTKTVMECIIFTIIFDIIITIFIYV
ncbi:MAG: ABC transporter permease [Spirochaetales bacterium]|nr:ABC transporter permease [Spirochaetales bacterium]